MEKGKRYSPRIQTVCQVQVSISPSKHSQELVQVVVNRKNYWKNCPAILLTIPQVLVEHI